MSLRWVILADDRTGAADAAASFRRHGHASQVQLHPASCPVQAGVVSIDLRLRECGGDFDDTGPFSSGNVGPVLREVMRAIEDDRQVYLKIDSTLRGPVRSMIHETRRELLRKTDRPENCRSVVVCPAFPAQRRTVRDGFLLVDGITIRQSDGTITPSIACRLKTNGEVPSWIRIPDAESDADLDRIVGENLVNTPLYWSGSAGLAAALARQTPGADRPPRFPEVERVVALVGSPHPVSQKQAVRLRKAFSNGGSEKISIVTWSDGFDGKRSPRISRELTGEAWRLFLPNVKTAWVLVGGETARCWLDRAGVGLLEVGGEIAPGIPWMICLDGPIAGSCVVTKAGGFGGPDTLVQIVEMLLTGP